MAQEEKNKVLEVTAIIILILLLWRCCCKKRRVILSDQLEPITTAPEMINEQFKGQSLKGQQLKCENIVHKPISPWGPVAGDFTLSKGWCWRGDGSFFDGKEVVYGDDYADDQAEAYREMKQDEAIRAINKKVIMIRLINNRPRKITTPIFDITQDPNVFDGSDDIGNTSRELLTEKGENILKENGEKILIV